MKKILVEYDLDDPKDKKLLLSLINENVPTMQPSSSSEHNPEGGGSAPTSPATVKQKALMDKHKIKYDSDTTKAVASDRISSFFDSKKKKKEAE